MNGRTDVHFDVRGHLPKVYALEQFLHAERHEVLILLPVGHGDLSANRQVSLLRGVFDPLIHFAAIGGCFLRPPQRGQQGDYKPNCYYTSQSFHTTALVLWPRFCPRMGGNETVLLGPDGKSALPASVTG